MSQTDQQSCPHCQTPAAAEARFCANCGARMESPEEQELAPSENIYLDEFEAQESVQLSRELFERHVSLVQTSRRQVKLLAKRIDVQEKALAAAAAAAQSPERTESIQAALEELESLGDEWEEIQLGYNRMSEELDEEFMDRFAEMEIDVELPEDLQDEMNKTLGELIRSFDRLGERVAAAGAMGQGLINRGDGHWFESPEGNAFRRVVFISALAAAMMIFAVMTFIVRSGIVESLILAGLALIPGVVALICCPKRS